MKLKKSDVNILIMLLGILIPVGVYFFVYNPFHILVTSSYYKI